MILDELDHVVHNICRPRRTSGEVSKPWCPDADDHREAAIEYLSDRHVADWEPQTDEIRGLGAVATAVDNEVAVVVTHRTVLAPWLQHVVGDFDAV